MAHDAHLSGFVLDPTASTWTTDKWPKLKDGGRKNHATVVLDDGSIVIVGGNKKKGPTDSVIIMDNSLSSERKWHKGPKLNQRRTCLAAVVCNGYVYVIGGHNRKAFLDTIDRIHVSNLTPQWSSSKHTSIPLSNWTTLDVRLPSKRSFCRAVVVHDRYIVILGGFDGSVLSTVHILDTMTMSLSVGPNMLTSRWEFDAAIMGNRIWIVGGHENFNELVSLEMIEFQRFPPPESKVGHNAASLLFSSSQWEEINNLVLPHGRCDFAMVAIGSCLVVAGGFTFSGQQSRDLTSVDVLDPRRGVIWHLPDMMEAQVATTMAVVDSQLLVLGGYGNNTRLDSSVASLKFIALQVRVPSCMRIFPVIDRFRSVQNDPW